MNNNHSNSNNRQSVGSSNNHNHHRRRSTFATMKTGFLSQSDLRTYSKTITFPGKPEQFEITQSTDV
eukprot:UN25941